MIIYFTTEDTEGTEDEEEKIKNLRVLCVLCGEINSHLCTNSFFYDY